MAVAKKYCQWYTLFKELIWSTSNFLAKFLQTMIQENKQRYTAYIEELTTADNKLGFQFAHQVKHNNEIDNSYL